jgi:hypothetical protein
MKPILPLIDYAKEVHTAKVSHPSTSVTPQDVSAMFFEHVKFTRNMVGEEIGKWLAKFLQNSKFQPTTVALHISRHLVHRLHLAHQQHNRRTACR